MFELGQKVEVKDIETVRQDEFLESLALQIIEKNKFIGEVTKVDNDLYFVGFENDLGWVTQVYKANEIMEVK